MSGCLNIASCCCNGSGNPDLPVYLYINAGLRVEAYARERIILVPESMDCGPNGIFLLRIQPAEMIVRGNCAGDIFTPPPLPPQIGYCNNKCAIFPSSSFWYPNTRRIIMEVPLYNQFWTTPFINPWKYEYTDPCSEDTGIISGVFSYFLNPLHPNVTCLCFVSFSGCNSNVHLTRYDYENYITMSMCNYLTTDLHTESVEGHALLFNQPFYFVSSASFREFDVFKLTITINDIDLEEIPEIFVNTNAATIQDFYDFFTSRNPNDISVNLQLRYSEYQYHFGTCPILDPVLKDACRISNILIHNTFWNCWESQLKPQLYTEEVYLAENIDANLTREEGTWTYTHTALMNQRITEFSGCPTREQCDIGTPNDCNCYGDDIETDVVNPCGVNCPRGGPYACFPPSTDVQDLGTNRFKITFIRDGNEDICLT